MRFFLLLTSLICFLVPPAAAAERIDIQGPAGSERFGEVVKVLPNGNFIVVDSLADTPLRDSGAVYFYDGTTKQLISRLHGSIYFDRVGSNGVNVLPSGDFIVRSHYWQNGTGAVTWCSQTAGCNGPVSAENSVVGARVGFNEPVILATGNYILRAANAVRLCSSTSPTVGAISAANSLVGERNDDAIGGRYVTPLSNGGYVVESPEWNESRGAVTVCETTGCTGFVTTANSLVGSSVLDRVGSSAEVLPIPGMPPRSAVREVGNGNIIVESRYWKNGGEISVGAITWLSSASGFAGVVSADNSLVGTRPYFTPTVTVLKNGNYVVLTQGSSGAGNIHGATFGNGNTGVFGTANPANTLIGSAINDDLYDSSVHALENGNYVVATPKWQGDGIGGAFTFCSGTTGCAGEVSEERSLVGLAHDYTKPGGVIELANGNFVVGGIKAAAFGNGTTGMPTGRATAENSLLLPYWGDMKIVALANGNYYVLHDGGWGYAATATFGNGQTGTVGEISSANSLTNDSPGGGYGQLFPFPLPNGDIVVIDAIWKDRGSITRLSGTMPTSGVISASNSIVGGAKISLLPNGNYLVYGSDVIGSGGAVRLCRLEEPCVGETNTSNSLFGTSPTDHVGGGNNQNGVVPIGQNHFVVASGNWSDGRGAATLVDARVGMVGPVSQNNSLVGTSSGDAVSSGSWDTTYYYGTRDLGDGLFAVYSSGFDLNGALNVGATTIGSIYEPFIGQLHSGNSLIGTVAHGGSLMSIDYDHLNRQVVIGHGGSNIVAIFRPAIPPPAALITGIIRTPSGSPIRNADVTLTGQDGVIARVKSSPLGYFTFQNVSAQQDLTIAVTSKRYRFLPRSVSMLGADLDVGDIIGIE